MALLMLISYLEKGSALLSKVNGFIHPFRRSPNLLDEARRVKSRDSASFWLILQRTELFRRLVITQARSYMPWNQKSSTQLVLSLML